MRGCVGWLAVCIKVCEASRTTKVWGSIREMSINNNFGEKKQWTQTLWGFVREAFGDG